MREPGKRGKAASRHIDLPTFETYVRSSMPKPPRSFDNSDRIDDFPMALNGDVENSPLAAAVHTLQLAYSEVGEVFHYPGDEAMRELCDSFEVDEEDLSIFEMLDSWVTEDIMSNRIICFAPINISNHKEMIAACKAFGSIMLGFSLPEVAEEQFEEGEPWHTVYEDPDGTSGHAVAMTGANPFGIDVITWGERQAVTWSFWDTYGTEAWVVVPEIYIEANHASCWGIDLNRMVIDLENLE